MIARDGTRVSLWQNESPYHSTQSNTSAGHYDVIIVGGGITGITTAWLLQQEGKKCAVLEANTLCYGTTGGTTAHLNTLLDTPYTSIIRDFGLDKAKLVAQATAEAIAFISSNVKDLSIDCGFEQTSAYLFSQDDEQTKELEKIYEACREVGLDVTYEDRNPVYIPFEKIIQVKGQAKFHPVRYVHALAHDFENAGGVIIERCRVTELIHEEDRIRIVAGNEEGLYTADSVIYATHIPPGINFLHLKCAPFRSYAMAVKLSDEQYPDELIYDMYDPYHYYRTQEIDGERFLIAGGEDHKTGHEENTDVPFRLLEDHLRKHFNVSEVINKWSSQYYEPVDGLPFIGPLPGPHKNLYVATGYSGNGMVFSTVAAHILTDYILGRGSLYPAVFSSERIKPIASFSDFVANNADVAKEFIGQLFNVTRLDEVNLPGIEDGGVFTIDNQKIGISKDTSGNIHGVHPACTHMKCSVQWNRAEQSWDCPCHGARYSPDGKVLNGPARDDLKPISFSEEQAIDHMDHHTV